MLAGEIDRPAVPQRADDLQEFVGAFVPVVLAQVVAVRTLFVRLAADDHVEQQPPFRVPLVRGRHLCGKRRREQPGAERDEELHALGDFGEHGGREPRVLAPRTRGREHADISELLGAARYLAEIGQRGGTRAAGDSRRQAVAAANDVTAVTVSG